MDFFAGDDDITNLVRDPAGNGNNLEKKITNNNKRKTKAVELSFCFENERKIPNLGAHIYRSV